MDTELSHTLLDLGFLCALGTSERGVAENFVGRGNPNTYDHNNGVVVVYDEEGRPWIIPGNLLTGKAAEMLRKLYLKRGAFVPHSNDGGHFIRDVLPLLIDPR